MERGEWEGNDPIGIFRKHLLDNDLVPESELDEAEKQVEDDVQAAVEFAEASEEPTWDDLISTIYVEEYRDESWPR